MPPTAATTSAAAAASMRRAGSTATATARTGGAGTATAASTTADIPALSAAIGKGWRLATFLHTTEGRRRGCRPLCCCRTLCRGRTLGRRRTLEITATIRTGDVGAAIRQGRTPCPTARRIRHDDLHRARRELRMHGHCRAGQKQNQKRFCVYHSVNI